MTEGMHIHHECHNQQSEHQLQLYKTIKVQVQSNQAVILMHAVNKVFCKKVRSSLNDEKIPFHWHTWSTVLQDYNHEPVEDN